jgi:hypothetical protein
MLEKMQPYDLSNVPSGMEQFVYEEERQRGSVFCNETTYLLVLALRWALYEYHESDYYNPTDYLTWKVLWKSKDDYGFGTEIYLFKDRVVRWDESGEEEYVAQECYYDLLATVQCPNGEGVIRGIRVPGGPYGHTVFGSVEGVCYLLQSAHGRNKWYGDISNRQSENSLSMEAIHNIIRSLLTTTWQLDDNGLGLASLALEYTELSFWY